jgi:hypothetical protein
MENRNRGRRRNVTLLAHTGLALLPLAIVAIVAGSASAQTVNDGSIGIYFDREGTICQGTIPPGPTGSTVYVLAKLAGQSAGGIAAAEFRFTGVPASWEVFPVANPDHLTQGNPFLDGVVSGFECESKTPTILLYTVLVLAHSEETNVQFQIEQRNPPANPSFPCPHVNLCDAPTYTDVCVEGLPCFVNATTPRKCGDPLAVSAVSWSGLKLLFR